MADNSTPTNDLTGDWQAIPLTGPPYPADRIPPDEYFGYRPGTFYSQPLWKQGLDYASVPVREIWGGLRGTAQAVYDVGQAIAHPRPPQFYAAPDSANLLQDPYLQHQVTAAILGTGMLGAPFGEVEGIPAFPAWHGSPYRFEPVPEAMAGPYGPQPAPYGVFDPSKMGTGEGTQYEGWGFYAGAEKGTGEHYKYQRPQLSPTEKKIYLDGQPIDEDDILANLYDWNAPIDLSTTGPGYVSQFGHVPSDPKYIALNEFNQADGSSYLAEGQLLNHIDNNNNLMSDPSLLAASAKRHTGSDDPKTISDYKDFLVAENNSNLDALDWLYDNGHRLNSSKDIVRLDGNWVNTREIHKRADPIYAADYSHNPFGHVPDPKDLAIDMYSFYNGDLQNARDHIFDTLRDMGIAKNKTPEQKEGDVQTYFPTWGNLSDDYKDTMMQRYNDYLDKNFDSYSKAYDWLNDNADKLSYGDSDAKLSPSLYQVWIHPSHDDMLLTNREWHLQPQKVQDAIRKNLPDLANEMDERYNTDKQHIYGRDLYKRLVDMTGSPKAASEALNAAGVPALRFRNRPSRYQYTDVLTMDGKRIDELSRANPEWSKFADLSQNLQTQPQLMRFSDLDTRLRYAADNLRAGSDQDRVLRDWLYNNWHRFSLGDHPDSTYNYVIFHPHHVSIIDREGKEYGFNPVGRNPFTGEPWQR